MTATENATPRRRKNVDYTMVDVPDFQPTRDRRSPLNDNMEKIVATTEMHNTWKQIGGYDQGQNASSAATQLRKIWGNDERIRGFIISTGHYNDADGNPKSGVMVKYNPDAVVPGAHAEWEASLKNKAAKKPATKK
jgi:hypothetical protein